MFRRCLCWCWLSLAILPLNSALAQQQDEAQKPLEVVVTANKVETPLDQVAASVTVIDSEQMEDQQIRDVADALRSVASVNVVKSGGPGGATSVFMRGANSEHTLVLIDGVPANNPITPNRAFNFANLSNDNIERIEVLRGPQGTLYGSDALGGVINIISKKGEGPLGASASAEAGSYNTFVERANVSGSGAAYNYSLGLSREDMQGISTAAANYGNTEHDGYGRDSLASRFGFDVSENISTQFFARYLNSRTELDNFGGAWGDDPNRISYDDEFFGRAEANMRWFDDVLKQTVGYSYSDLIFEDNNDVDAANPFDWQRSRYSGRLHKVDMQNTLTAAKDVKFILGLETQEELGSSRYDSLSAYGPYQSNFDLRSATTNSYYIQAEVGLFDRLYSSAGMRVDDHSKFGSNVTWHVGEALLFRESDTKLSTTVGTAFKAPSLYQLYSSYGNQDLRPEESLGVDATVEQGFFEKNMSVGLTYFHNKFDDLITFDPNTFIYTSSARASTQGLESFLRLKACDYLTADFSYTYTDSEDKDLQRPLLRRPQQKFSTVVTYQALEALKLTASFDFVGHSFDNNYSTYPASLTSLGSYALLNLAASYELSSSLSLFARVDNMLDRQYEQVYGYGNMGAAAYGGIKVKL